MTTRMFIVVFALISSLLPRPTLAADCTFVDSFRTLHTMIPSVVGDCVDNEFTDPATGDALQLTTNGLLHWRRGDGAILFTNGYRTWIFGLDGLQERLNTERFSWERESPPRDVPVTLTTSTSVSRPEPE